MSHLIDFLDDITGEYDVDCPEVDRDWPFYTVYHLQLTRSGSSFWGVFDLGVVKGIMKFPKPPERQGEKVMFQWRGLEDEGRVVFGNSNSGYITFEEDGYVFAEVSYMNIPFTAVRMGQATCSVEDLRQEWESYEKEG